MHFIHMQISIYYIIGILDFEVPRNLGHQKMFTFANPVLYYDIWKRIGPSPQIEKYIPQTPS